MVGGVCAYVDAIFFHGSNCARIHAMCFYTCAIQIGYFSVKMTQISFGKLTSAAVPSAKD
jgi:hypothetical protein